MSYSFLLRRADGLRGRCKSFHMYQFATLGIRLESSTIKRSMAAQGGSAHLNNVIHVNITKKDNAMRLGRWDGSPVVENSNFPRTPSKSSRRRIFRWVEGFRDWSRSWDHPPNLYYFLPMQMTLKFGSLVIVCSLWEALWAGGISKPRHSQPVFGFPVFLFNLRAKHRLIAQRGPERPLLDTTNNHVKST